MKPDPSDRQSDNYTIKVAIIEDHQEICDGLGFLIDSTEGYRLTASFGSVEEALERLGCDLPDVALVDIGLPGMSGIEGAKILKQRWADISIIALTVYDDDERIFDMLCAGASGYLLKKTPPARLIESLKDAVRVARLCRPKSRAASSVCFAGFALPQKPITTSPRTNPAS